MRQTVLTEAELEDAINHAWISGDFTLRSGQKSGRYFDKLALQSDPQVRLELAKRMVVKLADVDVIVGLALGAVPIATLVSQLSGKPLAIVRPKAKTYGNSQRVEGADIQGKRVVIVEDVISSGSAVNSAMQAMGGASVEQVLCLMARNKSALRSVHPNSAALFYQTVEN